MISTFSAINASLYGGSQVSYEIAKDGELPQHLTRQLWGQPRGLIVTFIITLFVANTLNLESISTAGSVGFLLIFAIFNFIGFKLASDTGSVKWIPLTGFILCLVALSALIIQQFQTNKLGVEVALAIVIGCFCTGSVL